MELKRVSTGLDGFVYMERYVNVGSRTYSKFSNFNGVAKQYQPMSDTPNFELPCVLVPREKVSSYFDNPDPRLQDFYVRGDNVLFPIHPEIFYSSDEDPFLIELQRYPRGTSLRVAPTSSTRTVMVLEDQGIPPHFLKLHCPRRISRFIRRLRHGVVQTGVAMSHDLTSVISEGFSYFPETLGIGYGDTMKGWGFLMREHVPRPHHHGTRYLIPSFALYSGDVHDPRHVPLLRQIVDFLGCIPEQFLLEHIMIPLVQSWCKVLSMRGIVLESHGQNTLLEVDSQYRPTRMVYRDLEIRVDPQVRVRHNLDMPFTAKRIGIETLHPRMCIYSLVYDQLIGHHLFDYLLRCAKDHFSIDEEVIRARVRETFYTSFPDAGNYFPETTYYFSDEFLPNNQYRLIDTGERPVWR